MPLVSSDDKYNKYNNKDDNQNEFLNRLKRERKKKEKREKQEEKSKKAATEEERKRRRRRRRRRDDDDDDDDDDDKDIQDENKRLLSDRETAAAAAAPVTSACNSNTKRQRRRRPSDPKPGKEDNDQQKDDTSADTCHDNNNNNNNINKEHAQEETAVIRDGRRGCGATQPNQQQQQQHQQIINFPVRYIVAPMVGASELPFRLLCRKYGAQLAYTPMMSARAFAHDGQYRRTEFQTCPTDRPLVCHFGCNSVQDFVAAARTAEPFCDAIDLNLGCPQRTAYLGHFGSYLLDSADRTLICDMVAAAAAAVKIPIFCKIRLLDTVQQTVQLCRDLVQAGASLIAIHARYRASWERKGPGARDGPALLEQVAVIQQELLADDDGIRNNKKNKKKVAIITNGNTITWEDVETNLRQTGADGLMSAEGLLDNPALFLPRYGSAEHDRDKLIPIPTIVNKPKRQGENGSLTAAATASTTTATSVNDNDDEKVNYDDARKVENKEEKKMQKLEKKMKGLEERIAAAAGKATSSSSTASSSEKDLQQLHRKKAKILAKMQKLQHEQQQQERQQEEENVLSSKTEKEVQNRNGNANEAGMDNTTSTATTTTTTLVPLGSLYDAAQDKLQLAYEYLDLVYHYPVPLRSVIFHIRRMIKDLLVQYQLLDDCINNCPSVEFVKSRILDKIGQYRMHPETFVYDLEKARQENEELERKKREEGKRKAYEERMIRKAKRQGKTDLHYYLHVGAILPTMEQLEHYQRTMTREEIMSVWKQNHSQHCFSFHLDPQGCSRGRACAFLHADKVGSCSNSFVEKDEVAG